MKELSLNILDITQNSISAGAQNIGISLAETQEGILTLTICDDGCGMTAQTLQVVMDPFYTTRTTRKVGMGISLLKLAAEQTGGSLSIKSVSDKDDTVAHGTVLQATFNTKHIDMMPVGDMVSTIVTILQGHPEIDYLFEHRTPRISVQMDTREMRAELGDIPLNTPEVLEWVSEFLNEQYEKII